MRTTLTLDDDVAAKLKSEVRRTGKSFKEAVNDVLRLGLTRRRGNAAAPPFRVVTRDLGSLQPGLSLDNVSDLLERAEGRRTDEARRRQHPAVRLPPGISAHERCRRWLEAALGATEPVGLAWITIFAFLRIITSPRIFDHPPDDGGGAGRRGLVAGAARRRAARSGRALLDDLRRPAARRPGDRRPGDGRGPGRPRLEHGATLCSTDRDFSRFADVTTINPLVDG